MNKISDLVTRFKDLSTIGFANLTSNAISALFWFYLASLLGTSHYGEVSYFISIASIASVISFVGAGNTIIIYTAKGEKIQAPIFFVTIIASVVASIVLFIMFFNFGVSLYIVGYTIFGLASSEILGRKLYKDYSKYLITQKILFVGFALGFYFLMGPSGVIVGFGLSFFPYAARIYKGFKESKLDLSSLKPRFGFMMNSYALDLSRTFSGNTDKLFVAPLLGFSLLGNYQLGIQFLSLLGMIPTIVYQYILPHDASGNPNKKLKKLTVLVSVILAVSGIFLAPKVLPIFFPKFTEAIRVIQIVSLAIIPLTINLMYISKFLGSTKSKIVLIGSGIYILVQISTILTLGKVYGINGVAGALVLASTAEALYLIIVNQYINRHSPPEPKEYDNLETKSENNSNSGLQGIVQNIPYIESIEKRSSFFSHNVIFSLIAIAVISIVLRLHFFPWGIPLTLDGYEYFRYAVDTNILGHLPTANTVSNNGWPILLSFFFKIFHFNNFMNYMNLQRFISIIISVVTIVPIYLLCRRFFDRTYAILGAAMFELEPHLIQNSLLGVTDSLFIFLITTSFVLFLRNKNSIPYLSFIVASIATMVRVEGFGIFLALSILFFVQRKIAGKNIAKYFIVLGIFVVLLLPITIVRIETLGSDALTSRLIGAASAVSTSDGTNTGVVHHILYALEMLVRFSFSASIPIFILFLPFGVYLAFKKKYREFTSMIIVIACMIPAAFYAYFSIALDNRFIFPLFPFFTILSILAIREFGQKFKVINSLSILIIFATIIASAGFLTINIHNDHEKEAYALSSYVANYTSGINPYPPESKYFTVSGITKTSFPTLSTSISEGPKQIPTEGFSSLEQYLEYGKNNGLTHLVIDNSKSRPVFLQEVFNHDENFPYLTKIFDSGDYKFKYHLKIYKIDYTKLQMLKQ